MCGRNFRANFDIASEYDVDVEDDDDGDDDDDDCVETEASTASLRETRFRDNYSQQSLAHCDQPDISRSYVRVCFLSIYTVAHSSLNSHCMSAANLLRNNPPYLKVSQHYVVKFVYYGRRRQGHHTLPLFFYFVSVDERPAMGSQPNLASRLEVVSIYRCPKKFLGALAKKQFLTTFCDFRTRHRISPDRNVSSTNKNASVNLQCVP